MKGIATRSACKGQGALIATAVITLVAMVTMALALNQAAYYNARRTVSTRESLQLYYVAQAGIQEALATRFVPRTNYLNFIQNQGNVNPPYYGLSGRAFQDPANPNAAELVGIYRYFILGGDPAVDPNTGLYDNNRYTVNDINQPVYVLSKGAICVTPNGAIDPGVIQIDGTIPRPSCNNPAYTLEELTILAKIDLSRQVDPTNDIVEFYRVFKDDTNIQLDQPVFVPDQAGQANTTVNFEATWAATNLNGTPLAQQEVRPTAIAFYNVSDSVPDRVINIAGPNTVVPPPAIDPSAIIKIYFNGGVDYRTMYINPALNQTIQNDCLGVTADREDCTIRVRNITPGPDFNQLFTNSTLFPNFPSETQLQLFPPLGTGSVLGGGNTYRIELDTALADWRGNRLPSQYNITFTTSP